MFSANASGYVMNELVTLCSVFLVVACHLAGAYNFQDSEFNLLLSSELENILDSLNSAQLHPRVRRDNEAANDEKCIKRQHKGKFCCAEDVFSVNEELNDISKSCFKKVMGVEKPDKHEHHNKFDLFSCEEVEKRMSEITCMHQCILDEIGVLNHDGSVDGNKLISHLKKTMAKEAWFASVVDKVVAVCTAEAKNATQNSIKVYTNVHEVCKPTGLTLIYCLFKETQLSCPDNEIKDKASCDKFREGIRKGFDARGLQLSFSRQKKLTN